MSIDRRTSQLGPGLGVDLDAAYQRAQANSITYLCGPMTGHPKFNHPAFIAMARALRAHGLVVFNPDGGQTVTAARGAALRVRAAFDSIKTGSVDGSDSEPHDLLAHALGVAWLRALQIAGGDYAENPMLPILKDGIDAVQRMAERKHRLNVWGLDGPGITQVADALDVYDEILMNSSPAQMAAAADKRAQLLAVRRKLPAAR